MTGELHVFVYGTLKPGAANFDRYCGNKVVNSHRAYIYGENCTIYLCSAIQGQFMALEKCMDL